eukprot:5542794-Prymnesium_polylepis.1
MAGSIRELSGQRVRAQTIVDGLERWVIAPAALAGRRRLFGRCHSLWSVLIGIGASELEPYERSSTSSA